MDQRARRYGRSPIVAAFPVFMARKKFELASPERLKAMREILADVKGLGA